MNILRPDRALDEIEPDYVAGICKYVAPRLDAMLVLRQQLYDNAKITNHGRMIQTGYSSLAFPVCSLPAVVDDHLSRAYGDDWFKNRERLYKVARRWPTWGFLFSK